MSEAHLFNIASHAAVGCLSAIASGGKCGPGAMSGAAGSFATPLTEGMGVGAGVVAHSVIGGVASVAGGGKFGSGAVTAAFGYLFNRFALWGTRQDEKDFSSALDYLRRDPLMASIIDAFEKSSTTYNIMFQHGGAETDEYQFANNQNIINWDPRGGANLTETGGGTVSPALLFRTRIRTCCVG